MKADGTEFPVEISISRIGTRTRRCSPPTCATSPRASAAEESTRQAGGDRRALQRRDRRRRPATARSSPGTRPPSGSTGGPADEIIGRHIADHRARRTGRARPTSSRARSPRARAVAGHRTVRMRKDGSLVDVSLTLSPILGVRREGGRAWPGSSATSRRRSAIERERVRLLEQETKARLRAEELEQRASFIVEIQAALDSSLELRRGAEAAHPPDRPDARGLVRDPRAGGRRLDPAGRGRPRGPAKASASPGSSSDRYPPDPDDPQGVPGVLRTRRAAARARDHRRAARGRRARRRAPRDHPRARAALGDDRAAARARPDARRDHASCRRSPSACTSEEDLAFASELARRAALSIDNARLHSELAEPQQGARVPGRRERRAGRDARPRRDAAEARRPDAVPFLGDGCMVDLLERERHDPARRVARRRTRRRSRCWSDCGSSTSTSTARTRSRSRCAPGSSSASRRSTEDVHETWTADESLPRRGARLARARGRRRADARARPDAGRDRARLVQRPHGSSDDDVRVVRELARRAAFAVDNARLYGETQLHRRPGSSSSLLPPHLPEIRGVEIAARFRPAGERNDVGGDFYDIFQTRARTAGRSRSATCAARAPTPQRSRRWRATRCARPRSAATTRPTSCCAR